MNVISKKRGSGTSPIRISPIIGEFPWNILANFHGTYWRSSGNPKKRYKMQGTNEKEDEHLE
ncbi:unnamed protein product, partial [Rotaria magnacalcarata]